MTAVEEPADAEPRSFAEAYRRRLTDGWVEDASQQGAVAQMSRLLGELRREGGRAPVGLYLHGPVGRGKSQLLNLFMQYVAPVPAYRTHMHAFMGQVHARLHGLKGGDPIKLLSKEMAGEFRVLGFDEFYITNIADAMLLGRLFEHLFKEGIVIVATSNWPMDELYLNGRNRKAFLPFLRLLKQHLTAIDLGDGRDYRRREEEAWPLYVVSSSPEEAEGRLGELFDYYAGEADASQPELPAGLRAKEWRDRAGWFEFGELCRWGIGRQEYLALVEHIDTLVVEDVPVFAEGEADAVLRFVTLIDICYEHRCRVVMSAPDYPEGLYVDGTVVTAFRRAASRLAEMQAW
jgi:cell division protein ZapE